MRIYSVSGIPSWLLTPPVSQVIPPTQTRLQTLPFEKLSWENFERLCIRLVRKEANVEHCQLYGERGEKQEGIDIFARQKISDRYRVYQCKRVKNFGPAKIERAASEFINGDWANKSDMFVLCTPGSFNKTKRADEFERQSKLLKEKGITLKSWDNDQLSMRLKDVPELVDDFFGREWVKAFCGEKQAKSLGKRLDVGKVTEFRNKLATFYKNVFSTHDPGPLFPSLGKVELLPLEERYVLPDIYEKHLITYPLSFERTRPKISSEELKRISFSNESVEQTQETAKSRRPAETYRKRHPIESWLINKDQSIVLGGPGSGKSAFLRYICIDLFKESPLMNLISQKWGEFLPIWIPFALWTRLLSSQANTTCSLSELIHYFLKSWDEERLWPLVKQALEDERLLLLVDGLDEWTNESAARIALYKLKVFIKQRNIPAIVTSRPHGFERLGIQATDWQICELSDFSITQQEKLVKIWFAHRIRSLCQDNTINTQETDEKANVETKGFLNELHKSPDLRELSKIPLLLCLLIYHKYHNVRLPQNRFKAYDSLIEHLISEHPQRRRDAALINKVLSDFSQDEIKMILSCLAYHIQKHLGGELIDHNEALTLVKEFLKDCDLGLGLDPHEARVLAKKILEVGENTLGLIVRRSPREIGFFHRVFQEYLSAYHLSRMSWNDQLEIVQKYCTDPQWREVVLSLFSITNRTDDIKKFVDHIKTRQKRVNRIERYTIELLICETAFGDFNCSVGLTRKLAKEIFGQIELGTWMPHRERLLNYTLDGLRLTKIKELVKSKLKYWFPHRLQWQVGIYNVMANWPQDSDVVECLWKGIHDENPYTQRASARALVQYASGDFQLEERIAKLSQNAVDPKIRAVAVEALLKGWPNNKNLAQILRLSRLSISPELRFVAIQGSIQRNTQKDGDWQELVHLDSWDLGLDFSWRSDVALALLKGWPKSPKTKKLCLESLDRMVRGETRLNGETALVILLTGYPKDQCVADFCVNEIKNEKYPFSLLHHSAWELLGQNFRDHPQIVDAIDEWIVNQEHNVPEISMAALVGRTQVAKAKLLSLLHLPFSHWPARALIVGWGMKDTEVANKLKKIAFESANIASKIGHLLPQIVRDKSKCRKRLLELLKDPRCSRHDFVMAGLVALGNTHNDTEVVDTFLNLHIDRDRFEYKDALFSLILGFSSDNRVKKLAVRELSLYNGNYESVARAYGDDKKIRHKIIEIVCHLPQQIRKIISRRIEEVCSDEAFVLNFLRSYDNEQDDEVKTQASISYHNILKAAGQDTKQSVNQLSESIVCYGPDYEERRQAAFCGLVSLERLDIMIKAKERIGQDKRCAISVFKGTTTNIPLVRHILQNWDYIKTTLGAEFWIRLSKFSFDLLKIWNKLCMFADEYHSPRDEAIRFLEDNSERKVESNILHFLGRVKPKSPLLLDYCLKTLRIGDERQDCSGEEAVVAAELIGSHFGGDNDVLAKIISERSKNRIYEKVILALCEGWPESEELDQIFKIVRVQKTYLDHPTYLQLICRKSTSKTVHKAILNAISASERSEYLIQLFYGRSVVRRLQTDERLLNMLKSHLQKNPTNSEKATIPRLIGEARGVSSELKAWCIEEIDQQINGANPPEIGVDLVAHERRPVVHSLLDLLMK